MSLEKNKNPHAVGNKSEKQKQMQNQLDKMAKENEKIEEPFHPLPIKEKINKHIQITMTDSIYKIAIEKASAKGMNLSQYIRYLIVEFDN